MPADEATALLQGSADQSASDGDSNTEPIEGSLQDAGTSNDAPQENVWFDAKKVPAELQPTFREMQASWTRKTQEAAEAMRWHKSFTENYGDVNEVTGFLDTLRDPDGLYNFVQTLAQELGITPAQAAQVAQQVAGNDLTGNSQQTPNDLTPQQGEVNPNDPNRPMTMGEFMAWQQQIQQQDAERQEDAQLDGILKSLNIPDEQQYYVLAEANRLPAHLGYSERLKRAHANLQSMFDAYASSQVTKAAETNNTAPTPFGGGMPSGGNDTNTNQWPSKSQILRDLGMGG